MSDDKSCIGEGSDVRDRGMFLTDINVPKRLDSFPCIRCGYCIKYILDGFAHFVERVFDPFKVIVPLLQAAINLQ